MARKRVDGLRTAVNSDMDSAPETAKAQCDFVKVNMEEQEEKTLEEICDEYIQKFKSWIRYKKTE